jgi:MFS family permease
MKEVRMSLAEKHSETLLAYGGSPFSWRFTTPSALNPGNSPLIATALLPIASDLGIQIGQTAALVAALYLASTIALPAAGKAAEVFGPRRVFMSGIVMVALGGVALIFPKLAETGTTAEVLAHLGE